jgi:uncharacterized protein involved in type VI secretion and phage assembly
MNATVEYLLQIESDFDLLSEIADRVGFDWWVDDSSLCFKPPAANPVVNLRVYEDLTTFSVRATGDFPDKVEVVGWDRKAQSAVSQIASSASEAVKATSQLASAVANPGTTFDPATYVTTSLAAQSQPEAAALSNAVLDRIVSATVEARGTLNASAQIAPGVTIQVGDGGPLNGSYRVTKVEHVYNSRRGFETSFVAGDRTPTSLVDVLGNGSTNGTFRHYGVVIGHVTNIKDPDKLGRVKVRFEGLSTKDESAWARLLVVGAGKGRGTVFVPELNDEVLVAFEGGDTRQPVVLGGLYGQKSTIPDYEIDSSGQVAARRTTSRLGHYIEYGDGSTDETAHIAMVLAGGKHRVRLGKDRVDVEVPAQTPIALKSGQSSITIDAQGALTISAQDVKINATNALKLSGATIEAEGKSQLKLSSNAATSLQGTTVDINGRATTTIKGSAAVQIN